MLEKIMSSSNNNFTLYKVDGIGIHDTPYELLEIRSKDLAEKHAVEIRLNSTAPRYEGQPIHYKYYDVYVAHGIRTQTDTLAETIEYIDVLQEAVQFAQEILKFIEQSDEWPAQ